MENETPKSDQSVEPVLPAELNDIIDQLVLNPEARELLGKCFKRQQAQIYQLKKDNRELRLKWLATADQLPSDPISQAFETLDALNAGAAEDDSDYEFDFCFIDDNNELEPEFTFTITPVSEQMLIPAKVLRQVVLRLSQMIGPGNVPIVHADNEVQIFSADGNNLMVASLFVSPSGIENLQVYPPDAVMGLGRYNVIVDNRKVVAHIKVVDDHGFLPADTDFNIAKIDGEKLVLIENIEDKAGLIYITGFLFTERGPRKVVKVCRGKTAQEILDIARKAGIPYLPEPVGISNAESEVEDDSCVPQDPIIFQPTNAEQDPEGPVFTIHGIRPSDNPGAEKIQRHPLPYDEPDCPGVRWPSRGLSRDEVQQMIAESNDQVSKLEKRVAELERKVGGFPTASESAQSTEKPDQPE